MAHGNAFEASLFQNDIIQSAMKQFGISVSTMIIRFYLMVIIVIIAGFLHQWWLSLVGGAIFMTSLLGLAWKGKQK